MQHILKIGSNVNVTPLLLQLKQNPQLWNEHNLRTGDSQSPHTLVDDIWVRYAADATYGHIPHESTWYADAFAALPAIREMAFGLMSLVQGERLGGILITRIPPGGGVAPHIDRGWHAEYYSKFAVQLASHPQQGFGYDDGVLQTAPGDIYWFNNQHTHWVVNDSPVERITAIFCIRTQNHKS